MSERLPRRAFLGYAGLGVSAAWLPRWLAAGFGGAGGQESSAEGARGEIPPLDRVLKEALERARASGKPLLVFVVPTVLELVWKRQEAFGQYLNLCDEEALADLALCEAACARRADIEAVIPRSDLRGEPPLVLIETAGAGPVARVLELELEEVVWPVQFALRGERKRAEQEFELSVTRRVDRLAELVHDAVAGDPPTLERRALQTRHALGETAEEFSVRVIEKPADASPEEVDRVASLLRLAAESRPDRRGTSIAALAGAARSRLRLSPPTGAWWASHTSCGHRVEGNVETVSCPCGMAQIPKLSRRFLHFYTMECDR